MFWLFIFIYLILLAFTLYLFDSFEFFCFIFTIFFFFFFLMFELSILLFLGWLLYFWRVFIFLHTNFEPTSSFPSNSHYATTFSSCQKRSLFFMFFNKKKPPYFKIAYLPRSTFSLPFPLRNNIEKTFFWRCPQAPQ